MTLLMWIPIFGGGAPPTPTLYRFEPEPPPAAPTGPLYRFED